MLIDKVLLRLEKVRKSYQMGEVSVEALKETSIDIYKGELLVILGPSGSGKSTLLNLLGGMDTPTEGRILRDGVDLAKASDQELTLYRREEVGFIFQFYNLISDLTALENVSLAAELTPNPVPVHEMMEEVGLSSRLYHFPAQMSGGEQQRVSIARALVKKPSLLLCDEPTGALDGTIGKSILEILEKLVRKYGNAVVIVTHNQAIAAMADRVLTMRNGSIVDIAYNPAPKPAAQVDL